MYRIIAIILLAGYATFATYQWWTTAATEPLKCENENLAAVVVEAEKEIDKGNKQVDAGEAIRTEVREVFVPVKEIVYEDRVIDSGCTGTFPDSVRDALNKAVDAANGELSTTEH